MSDLPVRVVTWSELGALVIVDDVRVRITRHTEADVWKCDLCGDRTGHGHCPHTRAAAHAPADPLKYRTTINRQENQSEEHPPAEHLPAPRRQPRPRHRPAQHHPPASRAVHRP